MIIKNVLLSALLACGLSVYGQQNQYLTVSKDGNKVGLSAEGASFLANLPLHCIQTEYPNKPNHTIEIAQEVTLSPKQLHPAFYGCLDWHSSVHGHWMLVKILKTYPNLPETQQIIAVLESSFLTENLQKEADYFSQYKLAKGFERTYGWAWLLKLDEELLTWDNPMAKRWHKSLQPLTQVIVQKWTEYLPKQTYPNRTGVHPNTAFGMVFALDWARTTKNTSFEQLLVQRSKDYYLTNKAVAATLEPDGTDFLSPSLEIADLMRRVLAPQAFQKWFNQFYTAEGLKNVLQLPIVSDRSDYQIVHLDGLALSKAWCLLGIAKQLPTTDSRKKQFQEKATTFLQKTLPNIANGNYGGDHWLGSFAMYALSLEGESKKIRK